MSSIDAKYIYRAHDLLMRVWEMVGNDAVPIDLKCACMAAAVDLQVQMSAIGCPVEVKAEEKDPA